MSRFAERATGFLGVLLTLGSLLTPVPVSAAQPAGPSQVSGIQGSQGIELTDNATGAVLEVRADVAPEPGAGPDRRRLVITPRTAVTPGTVVRLRIPPERYEEAFGYRPATAKDWTFAWPEPGPIIVAESAAPRLLQAVVASGRLKATFSEAVMAEGLDAAASIDGAPTRWMIAADGRVATTIDPLPAGPHRFALGTGPIDRVGRGVAQPIGFDFDVESLIPLLEAPDRRAVQRSPTGQQASFQGHPVDEETGFVYMRGRYYDPELGRFITADPSGYPDGPSDYAFGAGDPINRRDPFGLEAGTITHNCVARPGGCQVPLSPSSQQSADFLLAEALAGPGLVDRLPQVVAGAPWLARGMFDSISAGSDFVGRCALDPGACARALRGGLAAAPRAIESLVDGYVDAPLGEHALAWGEQLFLTGAAGASTALRSPGVAGPVRVGEGWLPTEAAGAESANAQAALARKLRALEGAQQSAKRVRTLPDGRIRYYGPERAAAAPGPTRAAGLVTEYNPTTGQVRQWYESYDATGKVIRVHPKMLDGQVLDAPHFPPTGAEARQ